MQLSTIEQLVRYWSREYDFGRVEARLNALSQVAQGGDVRAAVTDVMAIQAPDGLAGIHLNVLRTPPLEVAAALVGAAPVRRCPRPSEPRSMR